MKSPMRAILVTSSFLGWLIACVPPEQRLARSLAENGLWLELQSRLLQELERQPNSAELHNDLGVCYEALGKRSLAIAEYETALRLAPSDESIRANLEAAKKREKATEKPDAGGSS
jgi:tetratricopeptide (TPR) repeat protein